MTPACCWWLVLRLTRRGQRVPHKLGLNSGQHCCCLAAQLLTSASPVSSSNSEATSLLLASPEAPVQCT